MKPTYFIFASVIVFTIAAMAVLEPHKNSAKTTLVKMQQPTTDYTVFWKEIDSLENAGLPKSALKAVEKVYELAKKENNSDQLVKALIYKMKFEHSLDPDYYSQRIVQLENEIKDFSFPVKPLLHSMLGEMYWQYFQNNRWNYYDRTTTIDFDQKDLETWDSDKILASARENYLKSVEGFSSLQKNTLLDTIYREVIYSPTGNFINRPLLQDFLIHRALNFFQSEESSITRPLEQFHFNDPEFFSPAEKFVSLKFESADSSDHKYRVALLFQNLIRKHLNDENKNALLSNDLIRLKYFYGVSVLPEKESIYIRSIENLSKEYKEDEKLQSIVFSYLAEAFYFRAESDPEAKNPDFADDYAEAVNLCNEVLNKENSPVFAKNNCASLIQLITNKNLTVTLEKVVIPGDNFPVSISYRNIDSLYIRIYKSSYSQIDNIVNHLKDKRRWTNDVNKHIVDTFRHFKPLKEMRVKLPTSTDFRNHITEFAVPALSSGNYVVFFSNNRVFSYEKNSVVFDFITSSSLSSINRSDNEGNLEYYVFHRKSGKPFAQVKAHVYEYERDNRNNTRIRKETGTFYTDANGYFKVSSNSRDYKNVMVDLSFETDSLLSKQFGLGYENGNPLSRRDDHVITSNKTVFFIDRGIYRPGQTVYFKGIMFETDGKKSHKLITDTKTKVNFFDANHQLVSSLDLKTNEYGTFGGSFVIPQGRMNGMMLIRNAYGSKNFSVEEYKRPKFEVTFKETKGSYKLGEKVIVTGLAKSFSGAFVDGAQVAYSVIRKPRWRIWDYYSRPFQREETQIISGTSTTKENGEFDIEFPALPDYSDSPATNPMYEFVISANVTDINGETHSSEKTMTIGFSALTVKIDVPEMLEKTGIDKFSVSTTNPEGIFEPAKGKISVYLLHAPKRAYRERLWTKPDKFIHSEDEFHKLLPYDQYKEENNFLTWETGKEMATMNFNTSESKEIVLKEMKKWPSGKYVLKTSTKDKFGTPVNEIFYFTLYSNKDKNTPYPVIDFFSLPGKKAEPGEQVEFMTGSAEQVNIVFELEQDKKLFSNQWLEHNNELQTVSFPVKEEYRGNVNLNYIFVKYGRVYSHYETIEVPYTNKQLDITFSTFRDKLQPGEKEEWQIKIAGKKGEKVAAEMVATLYDASLDEFAANSFDFNIHKFWSPLLRWVNSSGFETGVCREVSMEWNRYGDFYDLKYPELNWFGFGYYYMPPEPGIFRMLEDNIQADAEMEFEEEIALGYVSSKTKREIITEAGYGHLSADLKTTRDKDKPKEKDLSTVQARTNFNETAFFYPQLMTNEAGEIVIRFQIPESLTKWKMIGFVHTKDLAYGLVTRELVTSKNLMIVPNVPRFFREGDNISLSVKISNISEKKLSGSARIMLFDALTMQPVDEMLKNVNSEQDFTSSAGESTIATWKLSIPEGIQAVTYRVVAKAGDFSDGEEMTVPVMSNRMLVTETMPVWVKSGETRTYKLDKLIHNSSSTLTHHQLTFEFTENPAWYAIQALPYMMEYPYECTEQTFSRFYANSIATHIVNSAPVIRQVFDTWKNANSQELVSKLEKNQELKQLLLEETPWVLDAKDETERKKRVALLFDLNHMSNELDRTVNKLKKGQYPSGGWPWFEGGPESWYITQHIVAGYGHLDKLGIKNIRSDREVYSMLKAAIGFIDRQIMKEYTNIKKYNEKEEDLKKDHLSYTAVHYLYARSFFRDIEIPSDAAEAAGYFKKQAESYWLKKEKYAQGMIALALFREGDTKTPQKILKSLKEFATYSDEMGMYWKESWGWYWYEAPVETQALMIEVFSEIANDKKSVDNMRIWLLRQKQTTDWKTTKATTEACYALLLQGTDWLSASEKTKIKIGNIQLDPKNMPDVKVEAGTGYFKKTWSGKEITNDMGNVQISKTSPGVSWGGLYWQYFEDLDKITPNETPLKLQKKLFREIMTDKGKAIEPVNENVKLKVGDKVIVRIELRVDREMEYVHMKDMRAACFEPLNVISKYKWQDGLGYYESTKDASVNFFFDWVRKGTYVFEYPLWVTHNGDFSNGITTIQSMYAPEFSSHSQGIRVKVGN